MPERVQLRRTKGWRIPENTLSVARPGPWGNPFTVTKNLKPGGAIAGGRYVAVSTIEDAMDCYRAWLVKSSAGKALAQRAKAELKGRNLACWCAPDAPCHADVLLRIANEA